MDLSMENTKKLGFGFMRLPKKGDETDIEQVKEMVDIFMAAGFTYYDTAWAYTGSEDALRRALIERYPRDSFTIATKNAAWIGCKTREDAIAQFETSLKLTNAGYFDYYLLHNLGESRTKFFDDYNMWTFVKEKKEQGLIKHVGFSFHSTPEELDAILTAHPEAEFVQLQINYADWENPSVQSRRCYEVARKHGKPVIVMEPVKGGTLANPPESVAKVFKNADENASLASWAIRFAASLDGVVTVLSGMSNLEQVKDNVSFMKDFTSLDKKDQETLELAQKELAKIPLIPCTTCNYCSKVCPKDIGISGSFTAMNFYTLYKNLESAKGQLGFLVDSAGKQRADKCIQCGACENACPQHIAIRDELITVAATLK